MNNKTSDKTLNSAEGTVLEGEMDELKRDMRSAQVTAWIQQNQQKIITAVVIFLLVMVGVSMWKETQKSKKEAAAMLYHQALAASDTTQRKALFDKVLAEYPDSGYRTLSLLHIAAIITDPTQTLLQVIHSDAEAELRWQARLDLAEYNIAHEKTDEAKKLLQEKTGKQYEQLRNYLLATLSEGAERIEYLKKAADAVSNDLILKEKIDALLAAEANT